MTDSVRESAEHLVDVVTSRSDAMKEMLATRLAAYEEMFSHSGVELGEKISRDAATLGNLITRQLERVRPHGEDLRLRTRRAARRAHPGRFRVDAQLHRQLRQSRHRPRTNEVTTSLDQRLANFQETLDSRTQTLTEGLSHPRHGHRQDACRGRQGSGQRRRQARHRNRRAHRQPRRRNSPTPSASASPTSTRPSARGRCRSPTRSIPASSIWSSCSSDAPKPSSSEMDVQQPRRRGPAQHPPRGAFRSRSRPTRQTPSGRSASSSPTRPRRSARAWRRPPP